MKKYDVIVIGSGCGMNIAEEALCFLATLAGKIGHYLSFVP